MLGSVLGYQKRIRPWFEHSLSACDNGTNEVQLLSQCAYQITDGMRVISISPQGSQPKWSGLSDIIAEDTGVFQKRIKIGREVLWHSQEKEGTLVATKKKPSNNQELHNLIC